jgi:hypothetical protein
MCPKSSWYSSKDDFLGYLEEKYIMGFFKMFGHVAKGAVNPVSQQVTARSASQIIEIVTGKPCSPDQFERLARAAELAIEFKQSDTKHDYAFQLLHHSFINEMFKDSWKNLENINLLQQRIRIAANQAIKDGLIENHYVIGLYED